MAVVQPGVPVPHKQLSFTRTLLRLLECIESLGLVSWWIGCSWQQIDCNDCSDILSLTLLLCSDCPLLWCSEWLAMDKDRTIAAEKARLEEEEANMLVGPELPAGVSQADMGDYGGALLPGEPLLRLSWHVYYAVLHSTLFVWAYIEALPWPAAPAHLRHTAAAACHDRQHCLKVFTFLMSAIL